MADTRIQSNTSLGKILAIAICLVMLPIGWYSIRWHFANAVGYKINPRQPESRLAIDWLIEQSPNDPQIRTSAGRVLETTFDMADAERSITEFERAAALSPNNYLAWLDLARARSANGDNEQALAAYENALRLAPNYASVNWAFGNFLIRIGDEQRAVRMISRAADGDVKFAAAAVATLYAVFDGSANKIGDALGNNETAHISMAKSLPGLGAYRDAASAWLRLDDDARINKYQLEGRKLIDQLTVAGQFRFATAIAASMTEDGQLPPEPETISNGGFESQIKLRDAGAFEWKIAPGGEPQIGLGESQKLGGKYSLWVTFNSFETAAFRQITQTVAVLPGVQYEFSFHYRSDVRSEARLMWEIAFPDNSGVIASSEPLTPTPEWKQQTVRFTAPAKFDGVTFRFNRDGCIGPTCPMTGRVMFDDIVLRRAN